MALMDTLPEAPSPIKIDGRKQRKKSPPKNKSGKTRKPRGVHWLNQTGPKAELRRKLFLQKQEEKVYGPRRRKEVPAPRQDIPDGYNRETAAVMWAEARAKAEKQMAELIEKGIVDPLDGTDDAKMAQDAMLAAFTTLHSASHHDVRLKAASLILQYTKAKPEVKSKVTVESAEDWLAQVLETEKADEAGPR